MEFQDPFSRSEFDWEREIRKDDARVSAYIAELPKYIDLPGEDGILMRTIKRRLGTEKDEDWDQIALDETTENPEDYPFPSGANWRAAPGGPLYHNSAVLARDLAMGAATCSREELRTRIMRILALYGQLMARSADLIDMSLEVERSVMEDEVCEIPDPLRIAIVKRLLSYQNSLTRELRLLAEESPELRSHAEGHLDATGMMHDYLVDLLNALRRHPDNNDSDIPF